MAWITAHLLDGFDHDQVVMVVDEEAPAREDDVTTSLLIGSAGSLTSELPEGDATVRISVPTRGLETTQRLDVRSDAHLLVSIEDGELLCRSTNAAPGFM